MSAAGRQTTGGGPHRRARRGGRRSLHGLARLAVLVLAPFLTALEGPDGPDPSSERSTAGADGEAPFFWQQRLSLEPEPGWTPYYVPEEPEPEPFFWLSKRPEAADDANREPAAAALPEPGEGQDTIRFAYFPPGALAPGSGRGVGDRTVYAPGIRFPVASHEAFLNSQVFRAGGRQVLGDECEAVNFSYPWRDTFCERRSFYRKTRNCPSRAAHQGVDIRAGTPQLCRSMRAQPSAQHSAIEVVAPEDGLIYNIGKFTVELLGDARIYRFMHLNMDKLKVKIGDRLKAGDAIGYVSNAFANGSTTIHLHFEIIQDMADDGWVPVSPYLSLVRAYERQLGGAGRELEEGETLSQAVAPE